MEKSGNVTTSAEKSHKPGCHRRDAGSVGVLLSLFVLSFGLRQNAQVRVSVFPEAQKFPIMREALVNISDHRARPRKAKMSQRPVDICCDDPAVVEDLLELYRGFFPGFQF